MTISNALYLGFKDWMEAEDEKRTNLCDFHSIHNGCDLDAIRTEEDGACELAMLFVNEGLDMYYPFNTGWYDFSMEYERDSFYANPARVSFVQRHIIAYEKEHGNG